MSEQWAKDRTVLVTGATAGFGRAVTERFLAAGARVIATGRRRERLAELGTLGDRVLPQQLDVTETGGVDRLLAELPTDFAAIDVLFNNAGLALGMGKAQDADPADWDVVIDTNVRGFARVTRAVLPGMIARGRGHVLHLGSVAGTYPYPGGHVYAGSKAFVHQFSLALRADLIGTPIRVTCIEPGMAETEFSQVRFKGDEAAAAKVYENFKALEPDDIAAVAEAVVRLPAHVNINTVEVMPTGQAFSPFMLDRRPG